MAYGFDRAWAGLGLVVHGPGLGCAKDSRAHGEHWLPAIARRYVMHSFCFWFCFSLHRKLYASVLVCYDYDVVHLGKLRGWGVI